MVFRKEGEIIPLSRIHEADEMTITVYSAKGTLHTCTRTLFANPESKTCVVAAHKKLYAEHVKHHGKLKLPGSQIPLTEWRMDRFYHDLSWLRS